ncbi:MAG: hypothetical protein ABIG42_02960 [bacterium]
MSQRTIQRTSSSIPRWSEFQSANWTLSEINEPVGLGPYRIGDTENRDEYEFEIINPPAHKWLKEIIETLICLDELEPNWDHDGASHIESEIIVAAIELLLFVIQENTPEPYVFPTLNGGVQFEWHTKKADLEIELISRTRILVLFEDDIDEKDWEQSIFEDLTKIKSCLQNLI